MRFLRRGWYKHKRIGKGKKKKVSWRKPKGRDNKMRENRKGKPPIVSIGYKKGKKTKIITIYNIGDLEKVKEKGVVILGKTGKKKRIEIIKKAKSMDIEFQNLNTKKFLEKSQK